MALIWNVCLKGNVFVVGGNLFAEIPLQLVHLCIDAILRSAESKKKSTDI